MKYIKLFENFSSDYPLFITVAPTEKYKRILKGMVNSEGKPSELRSGGPNVEGSYMGGEFRLNRFDLVKIARTPYASEEQKLDGIKFDGVQDIHWLSYDPENSEIYVRTSRLFSGESNYEFYSEFKEIDLLKSSDMRVAKADGFRKDGLIWVGGYYCKFPKGFEVGMEDDRGYFKITKVEH